jgi:hypothetical protein
MRRSEAASPRPRKKSKNSSRRGPGTWLAKSSLQEDRAAGRHPPARSGGSQPAVDNQWKISGQSVEDNGGSPLSHLSVMAGPGQPGAPAFSVVKGCFSGPSRSLPRHGRATRGQLRCPECKPCPGHPRFSCRGSACRGKSPGIANCDALTKHENHDSIQAAPGKRYSAPEAVEKAEVCL